MPADPSSITSSTEFISALVGAFVGSISAYLLATLGETTKSRNQNHAMLLRAQMALGMQVQSLANLRQQYLEPYRTNPNKALHIPEILHLMSDLRVALSDISFLAESTDPDIINRVLVAQDCYLTGIRISEQRNLVIRHLQEMGKIVELHPTQNHARIEIDAKGLMTARQLEALTADLYKSVDDSIPRIEQVIRDLEKIGRKTFFEKSRFLRFEPKTIFAEKPVSRNI